LQQAIRDLLTGLAPNGRYLDRAAFETVLVQAAKRADIKLAAPIKKAIFTALGERDPNAAICRDAKGRPEPAPELRDTENIPLPERFAIPADFTMKPGMVLPMDFGPDKPNEALVEAMRPAIETYMQAEVLPHVPDAWVDYGKTKVGYEIPINRHFYVYKPPRPLVEIEKDIETLESEIAGLLKGLVG
jgi:type I restriction enzyme M protein